MPNLVEFSTKYENHHGGRRTLYLIQGASRLRIVEYRYHTLNRRCLKELKYVLVCIDFRSCRTDLGPPSTLKPCSRRPEWLLTEQLLTQLDSLRFAYMQLREHG